MNMIPSDFGWLEWQLVLKTTLHKKPHKHY